MLWSESTVIVGFSDSFNIAAAANYLRSVIGFIAVKHKYQLSNSVLVEVHPKQLDAFISDVRRRDGVEYCEYNHLIYPTAFNDEVGEWSSASEWSCRPVRRLHRVNKDSYAGEGITIAIIDSGLSPHPYLPATSFTQSISFSELWPDIVKGNLAAQAEIRNIAHLERSWPSPMSSESTPQQQWVFFQEAINHLRAFQNEIWKEWLPLAVGWYNDNIRLSRAGLPNQGSLLPSYPIHPRGVCGPLRRVSLYSRNFVNDNFHTDDSLGHGTQMVGLISGKACTSLIEDNPEKKDQLSKFEVDVLGIVPNAELMILKCYDQNNLQASNVDAMIRALEHAEKHNADIIYFGLAFDPGPRGIPSKTAITLDRTIQHLVQEDVPVICPAGNNHKPELDFPAACDGVITITAEIQDKKGSALLAPYSNFAGPNETVHFSAFGGDDFLAPLSTDLNFGFKRVWGTSVAAAIATGIFAKYLSERYINLRRQQYEDVLFQTLRSGNAPSLPLPLTRVPRIKIDELITAARAHALPSDKIGAPYPSPQFGYGFIREFMP